MFELSPHAPFIISSYTMVTFVVSALIAWVIMDERKQNKLLGDLEAQGIRRRSAKKPGE